VEAESAAGDEAYASVRGLDAGVGEVVDEGVADGLDVVSDGSGEPDGGSKLEMKAMVSQRWRRSMAGVGERRRG
jgi:hypothetical protein